MSNIFISYNRRSEAIARVLVNDIESLGFNVWFDQDLSGGQAWWNQILSKIRECDALVFLMDINSLESIACKREFGYAAELGKPILPILASDEVSITLLPPELSQLNFIDYRNQDRKTITSLAKAIINLPPAKPLPDPLPKPPEVPVSYLGGIAKKLDKSSLSFKDQSEILLELKRNLKDPEEAEATTTLFKKFRKRRDIYEIIAEEIDDLIGKPEKISTNHLVSDKVETEIKEKIPVKQAKSVQYTKPEKSPRLFKPKKSQPDSKPKKTQSMVRPHPSPTINEINKQANLIQDLKDKDIIAKENASLQIDLPKLTPTNNELTLRQKLLFALTGFFIEVSIALLIMLLTENFTAGAIIANGIAGAMIGVITRGHIKLIIAVLIGFTIGFLLAVLLTPGYKDDTISNALTFGAPIGAILGAIVSKNLNELKNQKP